MMEGEQKPTTPSLAKSRSREQRQWARLQRQKEQEGSLEIHLRQEGSSQNNGQHPLDPPIGHQSEEVRMSF